MVITSTNQNTNAPFPHPVFGQNEDIKLKKAREEIRVLEAEIIYLKEVSELQRQFIERLKLSIKYSSEP